MIIRDDDDLDIRVDDEKDIFDLIKIPKYDETSYNQYSLYKDGKLYDEFGNLKSEIYHDYICGDYNLTKSYKYKNNNLAEIISQKTYSLIPEPSKELFENKNKAIRYDYLDEIKEGEEEDIVKIKYFYKKDKLVKKEEKSKQLNKTILYEYQYDDAGRIFKILTKEQNKISEEITYKYNDEGNIYEIYKNGLLGLNKIYFTYNNNVIIKSENINDDIKMHNYEEFCYYNNAFVKQNISVTYKNNKLSNKHYIYYNPDGLMTLQILISYKNEKVAVFEIWGYDEHEKMQDICIEGKGIGILDVIIELIEQYYNQLNTLLKENRIEETSYIKKMISNLYNELANNYLLWKRYDEAIEACNKSIDHNPNSNNYYTKSQIMAKLNDTESSERALLQARIFENKNK